MIVFLALPFLRLALFDLGGLADLFAAEYICGFSGSIGIASLGGATGCGRATVGCGAGLGAGCGGGLTGRGAGRGGRP